MKKTSLLATALLIMPLFMMSVVTIPVTFARADSVFTVTSPTFEDGKPLPPLHVFNNFGCEGENKAPVLQWKNAPAGTKSFAVTLYDPDAPTGSGWWHWTVFNIPASATGINGELPKPAPNTYIEGRTDYGSSGFGGACPPVGNKPHRYELTVWALGVDSLPLDMTASGAMVGYYIRANALAHASMTATYGR